MINSMERYRELFGTYDEMPIDCSDIAEGSLYMCTDINEAWVLKEHCWQFLDECEIRKEHSTICINRGPDGKLYPVNHTITSYKLANSIPSSIKENDMMFCYLD